MPELDYPPTQLQPVPLIADGCDAAGQNDRAAEARGTPDTDRGKRSDSTAEIALGQAGAAPVSTRPTVGSRFDGFLLLEEIGRGAFSRVFLAQQTDLADRPVVVKITASAEREANALARLQHPNIVPVYSAHRAGSRQVVCMPFLGTVTLADVYRTLEAMPSLPDSGHGLFSTLSTRRVATLPHEMPAGPGAPGRRSPDAVPALASMAGRSYVEAVLWLAARLADALAHAHDRGVIHRDLKPANVLLADDGQPMLLDFNLATPVVVAGDTVRGGTPQYMSPEQLEAFAGRSRPVDHRADLYSLGVMLFELLTRQSPFPRYKPVTADTLVTMIAERSGPAPRLRAWNKAISPAVESIVRRCLAADPAERYQSAHELKADLECHLAARRLAHAVEPSAVEQARKCVRRNQRVVSLFGLMGAMLLTVGGLAAWAGSREGRLQRLQATTTAHDFAADTQSAIVLLVSGTDPARLDQGMQAGEAALARYKVMERADWWKAKAVQQLPAAERERLQDRTGELLVLLGRATASRAVQDAARSDPRPSLERAFELNTAALACYGERAIPRSVWEQRAELAQLLGRVAEARQLTATAAELPTNAAADRLLRAHRHMTRKEYRLALPKLSELCRDEPLNLAACYMLGVCNLELSGNAVAQGGN